jgi:alanine racemase
MRIDPMRRAWMEVDCRALRANYAAVTQRIPAGCGMLPMVKADGYGVGASLAVRALRELEPAGFGVATLAEGLGVRADGWTGPIVVFTPSLPADLPRLAAEGMQPVATSLRALEACAAAGREAGADIRAHLEIDTGMGRYGLASAEASSWIGPAREIVAGGGVRLTSTFTHLHSAERDAAATLEQLERFERVVGAMRASNLAPGRLHVANSVAVLEYSGVAADMVRPGVWLYGVEVAGRRPEVVATVRARVLEVRDVAAGSTVSYGATWTAPTPSRLATLGIGYADGLRRCLSGRGRVLIHGRPAPIRGIISMDSTVVDVTGRDDVAAGDVATVMGRDGEVEITVEELAGHCDTIAYEILAGWSARVPKIGIDGDA